MPSDKSTNVKLKSKQLRKKWIYKLSESQNHRCCYCGIRTVSEIGFKNSATIDHIIPKSRGPNTLEWYNFVNDYYNLVMCCSHCNSLKGAKSAKRYIKELNSSIKNKKEESRKKDKITPSMILSAVIQQHIHQLEL